LIDRLGIYFARDFDLHLGARLNAFAQDLLLLGVVMAAATGDEQGFQRLGLGVQAKVSQQRGSKKDDGFFNGKGAENTKPGLRSCNRRSVSKMMNYTKCFSIALISPGMLYS
jgi:hypothetical protein